MSSAQFCKPITLCPHLENEKRCTSAVASPMSRISQKAASEPGLIHRVKKHVAPVTIRWIFPKISFCTSKSRVVPSGFTPVIQFSHSGRNSESTFLMFVAKACHGSIGFVNCGGVSWSSVRPPTASPRKGPSVPWLSLQGPTGVLRCPGRVASGAERQPICW